MNKVKMILAGIAVVILISCSNKDEALKIVSIKILAPFEMDSVTIPDFSNCKSFLITDYGAVQDDKEKNSKAISEAVNAANINGGGNVIIPKGKWLTKKIHLKSNVNLHLEKGAVLLFSENSDDYLPAVHSTWEGMECYNYSPLIYAYECLRNNRTGFYQ